MDSQITFSKVLSATWEVLKLSFNPIPTALNIGEVLNLIMILAGITIYSFFKVEWYSITAAVIFILVLFAAIRIQLKFKTKKERENTIKLLHSLRKKGVEIRNEGEAMYLPSHKRPPVNPDYENRCLDWLQELITALNDNPGHKGFIETLDRVENLYPMKVLNEHNERLKRIGNIIQIVDREHKQY